MDGLAAGSAGLAGGAVEVGDDDGADADGGAVLADSCGDGGLLGAVGEAVGGVFDVAAGEDGSAVEEEGRAYSEVAVRGVGVVSDFDGALVEVGDLGWCERRHGESEAIGCAGVIASRWLMVKMLRPIRGLWMI